MTDTGRREKRMATFQGFCSHFAFYMSIHTDTRHWKKDRHWLRCISSKPVPSKAPGITPGNKDTSLSCYTNSFCSDYKGTWKVSLEEGKRKGRMEVICPLSDWQVTYKPRKVTQDYARTACLLITNRIYFAKIKPFSWMVHEKDEIETWFFRS